MLAFASEITSISAEESEIILLCQKSLLFGSTNDWVNKAGLFEVTTMRCLVCAEICELVGAYAFATLPAAKLPKKDIGLYKGPQPREVSPARQLKIQGLSHVALHDSGPEDHDTNKPP